MKKLYTFLLFCIASVASAQNITFPDANFKARLLQASPANYIALDLLNAPCKIDTNNDGEISMAEAANISALYLATVDLPEDQKINDITGYTNFANLISFDCYSNNLTELDMTTFPNMVHLSCEDNNITALHIEGLNQLRTLRCSYNQLTTFDLSGKTLLRFLQCQQNLITSIDLSDLAALEVLTVGANPLSELDLSNNPALEDLSCGATNMTHIDVSTCHFLESFLFGYSDFLTTINMKNGSNQTSLNTENLPNLQYICVDEGAEMTNIQNHINMHSYNCVVNSYCTFVPGGNVGSVSGTNKFDMNGNGCDSGDVAIPHLKYQVATAGPGFTSISDASGNYLLSVGLGEHTITPILENPLFFTVTPSSVVINYSNETPGPFVHNFCISPNGTHHDLEVTALPVGPAVPGFDASYEIVFRNKGNQVESGQINFTFDDSVFDFISSTEAVTTAAGMVTLNFAALQPFESRSFLIKLNLNSPMETPPVNGDDILSFTATVSPASTDEVLSDNTATIEQTVVNSFDPNHKTCVEGATIPPSMIGDYVHYVIEFENLGTFPATNIVVKDMIDTSKFDVSTLVPIASSHPFTTRITQNKVEFVFEGINLPFDDANNDGFVAFKIKTKPTLVLGNAFSNTASIYFDYNFPIVTNTETTTIAALSTNDFDFASYFTVYPNPVNDVLNISATSAIELQSITIYNMLGQQLLVVPNAQDISTIDVSSLQGGTYFIKVSSDKGSSSAKFIKQ